jgi:hypothetical protein
MDLNFLQNSSQDFRNFFLKNFTRELIINQYEINGNNYDILKLSFTKKNYPKIKNQKLGSQELSLNRLDNFGNVKKENKFPLTQQGFKNLKYLEQAPRTLNVPKVKIPKELFYLKPNSENFNFSIGKLDVFVNEPNVQTIECNGPGKPIFVSVNGILKKTNLYLEESEINEIFEKFSKQEKIPLIGGVIKIASGNLLLLGIISDIVKPKFILKKITRFL